MFKPVLGFEGFYSVSDAGEVIRHKAKFSKNERPVTAWPTHRGYLRVKLSRPGGKVSTVSVHKLVMEAFVGPMTPGMTVNHRNCDKTDNRLENLEYCTPLENTRHAVANGKVSLGLAFLSKEQVHEIRRLYVWHKNSRELAERFGVTQRTIVRIANGEIWKHLTQKPT